MFQAESLMYFESRSFSDHGPSREFTHHEIIFPMVYNVKGSGKVEKYLEINDIIVLILKAHISS